MISKKKNAGVGYQRLQKWPSLLIPVLAVMGHCGFAWAFLSENNKPSFRRRVSTPQDEALLLVSSGFFPNGIHRMQEIEQIRPFSRIRTNTMHLLPRSDDRYSREISSSLLQDSEPVAQNTKSDEYRIIPDNERDINKVMKPGKNRPKPRLPSTARPTAPHQPEWALHFSATQQQLDQLKRNVQNLVEHPIVECAGAALIILSSILVALTTLPDIPHELLAPMEMVQETLAYVFFAEFLTRWLSCNEKQGGYVTQPLVLVDVIVVVLPLLLTSFPLPETAFLDVIGGQSSLINLRLLRVLRLQRVLRDEMTFSKFVSAVRHNRHRISSTIFQAWELQLARVILSIFTLLSVAAGLIYTTEHVVNPNIDDYFTALYFTLTTLTTG
jgi:Ion transport protein